MQKPGQMVLLLSFSGVAHFLLILTGSECFILGWYQMCTVEKKVTMPQVHSRNVKILKWCRKSPDAICVINLYKDAFLISNTLNHSLHFSSGYFIETQCFQVNMSWFSSSEYSSLLYIQGYVLKRGHTLFHFHLLLNKKKRK